MYVHVQSTKKNNWFSELKVTKSKFSRVQVDVGENKTRVWGILIVGLINWRTLVRFSWINRAYQKMKTEKNLFPFILVSGKVTIVGYGWSRTIS